MSSCLTLLRVCAILFIVGLMAPGSTVAWDESYGAKEAPTADTGMYKPLGECANEEEYLERMHRQDRAVWKANLKSISDSMRDGDQKLMEQFKMQLHVIFTVGPSFIKLLTGEDEFNPNGGEADGKANRNTR